MHFLGCVLRLLFFTTDIWRFKNLLISGETHFTAYHNQKNDAVKAMTLKRLVVCLQSRDYSQIESLRDIFKCESSFIKHCISREFKPGNLQQYHRLPHCGRLYLPGTSTIQTTISIFVRKKYVLELDFLIFDFYRTFDSCGPDQVNILDDSLKTLHMYCGKRVPWKMTITRRIFHVRINLKNIHISRMTLFYYYLYTHHIDSIITVTKWPLIHTTWSLNNMLFQKTVAHSISFCVSHQLTIIAQVKRENEETLDTIEIFDGPGKLSSSIMLMRHEFSSNIYEAVTSAFNIYILIKHTPGSFNRSVINLRRGYAGKTRCNFRSNKIKHIQYILVRSSWKSGNVVCMHEINGFTPYGKTFPLIYIQRFVFTGPNTLESYHTEGCNYGGVFIRMFDNSSYTDRALCEPRRQFVIYMNVTRIQLYIVWFRRYSKGALKARIQFRKCPTTYAVNYLSSPGFNELNSCHYYVCVGKTCTVQLEIYGKSLGPSDIKVATANNMDGLSVPIRLPFKCKSEIRIRALLARHWIFDKSSTTQYSGHHVQYAYDNYTESFDFLHNSTVTITSCDQSPAAVGLVIFRCGYNVINADQAFTRGQLYVTNNCKVNFTKPTILYYVEPEDVQLSILVATEGGCQHSCWKKTIVIHEVVPQEGAVYNYNFSLASKAVWTTHKNQAGFRLQIISEINCTEFCAFRISISHANTIYKPTNPDVKHLVSAMG